MREVWRHTAVALVVRTAVWLVNVDLIAPVAALARENEAVSRLSWPWSSSAPSLSHAYEEKHSLDVHKVAVATRADPDDKKRKSVKDKIWEMGRAMCEGRPDHPSCDQFREKTTPAPEAIEEATASPAPSVEKAAPAPAVAQSEPAPAPEPDSTTSASTTASTATTVTETTATTTEATTTSEAATTSAAEATTLAETTHAATQSTTTAAVVSADTDRPEPGHLPSQGFRGKGVRHIDGETATSDWHDEYEVSTGTSTTSPTGTKPARSSARGTLRDARFSFAVMAVGLGLMEAVAR